MRIFPSLTMMLLSALLLSSPNGLANDVEEQVNQIYDLAPGGIVSVKNVNGSITVNAWERAQVEMRAVKKGKTQQDLDNLKIEIDHQPSRLSIQTKYPKSDGEAGHGGQGSVSYTLMVPISVNLDAIESVNGGINIANVTGNIRSKTVNGSVKILNANGATDVDTVNGSITVELQSVAPNKSMKFAAVNGSIKVYAPANLNAEVSAKTVHGNISTDFPLTVQGERVGKTLQGTLGSGGSNVSLKTVNGSLQFLKGGKQGS